MYWSGCQSTGAEIRKYLTAARVSTHEGTQLGCLEQRVGSGDTGAARTVVDLLQGDDAVRRQALLSVLI
jgi:hypothetical protein